MGCGLWELLVGRDDNGENSKSFSSTGTYKIVYFLQGGYFMTAKQEVRSLLQKLPNNCTLEDIQYHLYVIEKINRGLARIKKEGGIPHKEVKKRLAKWIVK